MRIAHLASQLCGGFDFTRRVSPSHGAHRQNQNLRSPSQIVLLLARSRVLVHVPLYISVLVLCCALPDLEQAHRHSWTDFCQLDALVARLDEDMVSHLYAVFDILECDHSGTQLRTAFSWREQMLQNLQYTLTELCCETLEDEMRIAFADCSTRGVGNIVSQYNVV